MAWLILAACQRRDEPAPPRSTLPLAKAGVPMPATAKVVFVGSDGGYEVADTLGGARTPVPRAASLEDELFPPPPEEPIPDLPEHEGTMVTLDEGAIERQTAERDPAFAAKLARQRAEEQRMPDHFTGEVAHLIARPVEADAQVVIAASPDAPATAVIAALESLPAGLAIQTPRGPAAFALAFRSARGEAEPSRKAWVEQLRDGVVDPSGGNGMPRADTRLDVLADERMTAQELVTAIETARAAGWQDLGLGASTAGVAQRRAEIRIARGPTLTIGHPNKQGELEKADMRRVVRAREPALFACYAVDGVRRRDESGTVAVRFAIQPDGTTQNPVAVGVSPELSACVRSVFAALQFAPAAGPTEVFWPLTYRRGD